jgi:hypothetical protein
MKVIATCSCHARTQRFVEGEYFSATPGCIHQKGGRIFHLPDSLSL